MTEHEEIIARHTKILFEKLIKKSKSVIESKEFEKLDGSHKGEILIEAAMNMLIYFVGNNVIKDHQNAIATALAAHLLEQFGSHEILAEVKREFMNKMLHDTNVETMN
jgi:hypothetical protein